jgi:hypothetical protein
LLPQHTLNDYAQLMSKNTRITVDRSVGPQPHLRIDESTSDNGLFKYTVSITRPDGGALLSPIIVEGPLDANSVAFVTAQAISKENILAYGYNSQPYLYQGNRWVNADGWLKSLSHSMQGLIRTGTFGGKSSRCFYNLMHSAWLSAGVEPLELKPFGRCLGIPVEDAVIVINEDGQPEFIPHSPAHQNLHVLPVRAQEVTDEYVELALGLRDDSVLMQFLRSSLGDDQLTTIRRWFGLHLVVHRVGNPEKMLYMFGKGGNGKGVIVGLLRALVTNDAVATLRLKDLRTSSNLELLIGKMAMIGAEASPETDNEMLKTIVSWEELNVNPKYRDPFGLKPQCLVTQASNPPPHFDDDSDAMVRRVVALEMEYQPSDSERVVGIADVVKRKEYALLVAFALQGATEVVDAGTIVVPDSVAAFSAHVVRPVRATDRFMEVLEYGAFEIADDELYAAYRLTCQRQRLSISPKNEFFLELTTRLERAGTAFLRRAKATGYKAQQHISDANERTYLVPQLQHAKSIDIVLGLRISEGQFGPAIGQEIPESRRDVPVF